MLDYAGHYCSLKIKTLNPIGYSLITNYKYTFQIIIYELLKIRLIIYVSS